MQPRDNQHAYGSISMLLHWITAILVIGLFALGVWMVDLSYYDPWYRRAPDLHKSIGVLLFLLILVRFTWRLSARGPGSLSSHRRLERQLAKAAHRLLYLLLLVTPVFGYLISTADGRPVDVFGLFSLPAIIDGFPNQEDVAGDIHWILALMLVIVAGIHALAALKHHFIDRDRTLIRMIGGGSRPKSPTTEEQRP